MDLSNVSDTRHAALALEHPSVCLLCQLWNNHCRPQRRAAGQRCSHCQTNTFACLNPGAAVLLFGDDAPALLGIGPLPPSQSTIHYEGPESANSRLAGLILRQVATLACVVSFPWDIAGSHYIDLASPNSHNGGATTSGDAIAPCLDDHDETMSMLPTTEHPDREVPGDYINPSMPGNTAAGMPTPTQPSDGQVCLVSNRYTFLVTIPFSPSRQGYFSVPHALPADFIPREGILNRILQVLSPGSTKALDNVIFLEGLPGSGKTTMALHVAFELRDRFPEHSVFWLSATSLSDLYASYKRIANVLGIKLRQNTATDHLQITEALAQVRGRWLCIIDTEQQIRPGDGNPIWGHLPRVRNGTILITGRSSQSAASLGTWPENIINVSRMSDDDASKLWRDCMLYRVEDAETRLKMVELLGHSPLAIKRACRYIAVSWSRVVDAIRNNSPVSQPQPVNATISLADKFDPLFHLIMREEPFAWEVVCFMCYLDAAPVPVSLLPEPPQGVDIYQALQRLKEYSFIFQDEGVISSSFRVNPIVQLSLRVWLQNEEQQAQAINTTMVELAARLPPPTTSTWEEYFPHLRALLGFGSLSDLKAEVLLRSKFGLGLWATNRLRDAEKQLMNCVVLSEESEGHRPVEPALRWATWMMVLKLRAERSKPHATDSALTN
ncbi:unnamed protein product [Clonostachys rosea]|uniref:NB-ARC domain-containing protein n=1 Tax=Bionectria ochroleuca TaxID=29856 RepID=A0ABY6UNJ2_BIOOC|nr:unnamed protein product [Clonostachys rosea]